MRITVTICPTGRLSTDREQPLVAFLAVVPDWLDAETAVRTALSGLSTETPVQPLPESTCEKMSKAQKARWSKLKLLPDAA